jgi:hypothetical protein
VAEKASDSQAKAKRSTGRRSFFTYASINPTDSIPNK